MKKWEYLELHLVLEQGKLYLYQPPKIFKGEEVVNYINTLGKEGWELINAVEETGNERSDNKEGQAIASLLDLAIAGPRVTNMTQHRAVTLGYFLWFKRAYEPKICKNCKAENSSADMYCNRCGTKLDGLLV